jgi:hypothetical protein
MRPLTTAATAQLNIGQPRRMREGATRALRSFIRLVCVSTLLSACNSQVRESFTADDEAKSTVLGIPNVRSLLTPRRLVALRRVYPSNCTKASPISRYQAGVATEPSAPDC